MTIPPIAATFAGDYIERGLRYAVDPGRSRASSHPIAASRPLADFLPKNADPARATADVLHKCRTLPFGNFENEW